VLPCVTHAYLSPPESTTQMASQSVQPFLHSSQQSVVTHVGACPSPLKIAPSHGASGPASDTWFFGSILLIIPKGISISSAVFAQLTAECPYTLQLATPSPSILPLPMGDLDPPSDTWFPAPPESSTQTASSSVEPFLQGSPL